MLNFYVFQDDQLVKWRDPIDEDNLPPFVWLDVVSPTWKEETLLQDKLRLRLPTNSDYNEPISNRDEAIYLNVRSISLTERELSIEYTLSFILLPSVLISINYNGMDLFARRHPDFSGKNNLDIFFSILVDEVTLFNQHMQQVSKNLEELSTTIFQNQHNAHLLKDLVTGIGMNSDLVGKIHYLLKDLTILLNLLENDLLAREGIGIETPFGSSNRLNAMEEEARMNTLKPKFRRMKSFKKVIFIIDSLSSQCSFFSSKCGMLLDATLGLINLEQNQIIKIFSVVSVLFIPATLIASIYGMNFQVMPELHLTFGYPLSIILMILSGVFPLIYFKKMGWL